VFRIFLKRSLGTCSHRCSITTFNGLKTFYFIVLHLGCINMDLGATQIQCFQLYIYLYIMSINKSSLFVFFGLFVTLVETRLSYVWFSLSNFLLNHLDSSKHVLETLINWCGEYVIAIYIFRSFIKWSSLNARSHVPNSNNIRLLNKHSTSSSCLLHIVERVKYENPIAKTNVESELRLIYN
jgi:hypothetical protein